MDKLTHYRQIVQQILSEHAEHVPSQGEIESIPVLDQNRDQYLLVDFGWDRNGRVFTVSIYMRIHNGKIWIEQDNTDANIAEQLVAAGIPAGDIVLGFYRPERREITDFAVA